MGARNDGTRAGGSAARPGPDPKRKAEPVEPHRGTELTALAGWLGLTEDGLTGMPEGILDAVIAKHREHADMLHTLTLHEDLVSMTQDLVSRLRDESRRDPLTGAANRRAVDERFCLEAARSRRTGRPLGLVLVDVEGLKRVNDTYGHVAGDRALRAVAARLRGAVRGTDLVGRIGGDEFVVLMPDTGGEALAPLATKLALEVNTSAPTELEKRHAVTAGWASTDQDGADTWEALLSAADRRLYGQRVRRRRARTTGAPRPNGGTLRRTALETSTGSDPSGPGRGDGTSPAPSGEESPRVGHSASVRRRRR